MKKLTFILLIIFGTYCHAEEYFIDDYELKWTILTENKMRMDIIKTEETTNVSLFKNTGLPSLLKLTSKEAVDIASALKRTREFLKKQKGTQQDVSESVTAGDYIVLFRTSVKYGFSVSIHKNQRYRSQTFSLSKNEAIKLQPELEKAPKLIKFIDSKIDF